MHKISLPLLLFLMIVLMALAGPFLTPYSYSDIHLSLKNMPPGSMFWFGSDELGRDLFTRVWWGARISLFVAFSATLINTIFALLWGGVSGYCGGLVDEFMMRVCDILQGIPHLLFVILITVVKGAGFSTLLLAMTLTGWVHMARVFRAQVLQIKTMDYVFAAKSFGSPRSRIFLKHLLPNALPPMIALITLSLPTAIFHEAFLSFLGFGIQAPMSSWGMMLNDGVSGLRYFPWRVFFPAFFLCLTIFCLQSLGSSLSQSSKTNIKKPFF